MLSHDIQRACCAWLLTLGVAFFACLLIVLAPLLKAGQYPLAALLIYQPFKLVCHQIPARSFMIDGLPFAVCARCTGIYFGLLGGILIYPFARSLKHPVPPPRVWIFLSLIPMGLDWSLDFVNLYANTHVSRLLTGAWFGVICACYVVVGCLEIAARVLRFEFNNSR